MKELIWASPSAPVGNALPNLAAVRISKGVSRRELAEISGYSHTHIVKIERGQRGASGTCVVVFADSLGVTPAEIL